MRGQIKRKSELEIPDAMNTDLGVLRREYVDAHPDTFIENLETVSSVNELNLALLQSYMSCTFVILNWKRDRGQVVFDRQIRHPNEGFQYNMWVDVDVTGLDSRQERCFPVVYLYRIEVRLVTEDRTTRLISDRTRTSNTDYTRTKTPTGRNTVCLEKTCSSHSVGTSRSITTDSGYPA